MAFSLEADDDYGLPTETTKIGTAYQKPKYKFQPEDMGNDTDPFEPPEEMKTYFDRSLSGCLVDLVSACLQHRPGLEHVVDLSMERYAADILDPFFRRLAETCVVNRPMDLPGFMLTWVLNQQGPEPDELRQFVAIWLGSKLPGRQNGIESDLRDVTGAENLPSLNSNLEMVEDKLLKALEAKHAALVDALCSTGMGICMLQKLAEGPQTFEELGLPMGKGDVEPLKLVKDKLEFFDTLAREYHKVKEENAEMKSGHAKARQAFHDETAKMKVQMAKLRRDNDNLNVQVAELKDSLAFAQMQVGNLQTGTHHFLHKEHHLVPEEPDKLRGRSMTECIQLILQTLMNDEKYRCASAIHAWKFFEPDASRQVSRDRFKTKIDSLGILTKDEILDLVEYVDFGGSGNIDYEEWKAGLMMALAASPQMHALPTEQEFNAMMYRIKSKLEKKKMTIAQAFKEIDLDKNQQLSHEEFIEGMHRLELGLSAKELTQLFTSMDADQGGTIDLAEFMDAIEEGSAGDTMMQVVKPYFKKIGHALIQKACVEEMQEIATPVGSDMLSFDGFVQIVRLGMPEVSLSQVMNLWCIVDKCGQSGLGFANIPDLVRNIIAASLPREERKKFGTSFTDKFDSPKPSKEATPSK